MNISISKKEVFKEVEKRSSLEGYVVPERYEKVWANDSRGELLDSFWVEGYTAVIQLMKRYIDNATIEHDMDSYDASEVITIKAKMPGRYNSMLDGSVATDVKMMIACNVLHGWMEVVFPESASKYEEEAKGYAEDLRVKLLHRDNPTSTTSAASADNAKIGDTEAILISGRSDSISLNPTEASLVDARVDDVSMDDSEASLVDARVDDVCLRQGWGMCCRNDFRMN